MNEPVRRWSPDAKRRVIFVILILLALVLYRFRGVLPPLVIAVLLAFILDPIADFLEARTPLSRTAATAIVFLVLIAPFVVAPAVAVPSVVRAVRRINLDFARLQDSIDAFFAQPLTVLGYELDLREVYQQFSGTLRGFVSSVVQGTAGVVFSIASGVVWLAFILIASFYLVKDGDRITAWIDSLAPPEFRDDFLRLRRRITQVWNSFLRGQLLLSLAMAIITTLAALAVGLPYAPALGVVAGLMELVPNIGPLIALVPAVLVALFEGSSWLPLSNFWFAIVVVGVYILIQQVEGNVLVPRILGGSLNLHPLIVLVAIIAGGSLAGILGMLLAAPTVASLRVLAEYVFCRLYDRDPFQEPEARPPPESGALLKRIRERLGRARPPMQEPEGADLPSSAED